VCLGIVIYSSCTAPSFPSSDLPKPVRVQRIIFNIPRGAQHVQKLVTVSSITVAESMVVVRRLDMTASL
jgi:hypothetical protein